MDQFNKVLAAFLLLVVGVGISLFIFSRLGILSRIFPSSKLVSSTTNTQVTKTPTPTQTVTPTPPNNKPGILGWLSQLGKAKATLTPSPGQKSKLACPDCVGETLNPNSVQTQTPTPITNSKSKILNSNDKQDLITPPEQRTPTQMSNNPNLNITIIPYGSTSASTYPASGVETMLIPAMALLALFGILLKNQTKQQPSK